MLAYLLTLLYVTYHYLSWFSIMQQVSPPHTQLVAASAHKLDRYYCINLKFIFFIVHILKALFNSVRVANNSQTFFNKEDNRSSQITDVSIKDVYREQRRYESFWKGVNRGIYLDSINPKLIDGNKNKRALTMKKVMKIW